MKLDKIFGLIAVILLVYLAFNHNGLQSYIHKITDPDTNESVFDDVSDIINTTTNRYQDIKDKWNFTVVGNKTPVYCVPIGD